MQMMCVFLGLMKQTADLISGGRKHHYSLSLLFLICSLGAMVFAWCDDALLQ